MRYIALMLAGTAALYALSLAVLAAPCWALFFVVAATAWPIWCYRHEHASFERRAILAGLGALLGGRFAASMQAELERHVFGEARPCPLCINP